MVELKNLMGQTLLRLEGNEVKNMMGQTIGTTRDQQLVNLQGQVLGEVREGKVYRGGEAPLLIEAGASYVCMGRLLEGRDLLEALRAAEKGFIEEKRSQLIKSLAQRHEVLP